MRRPTTALVVLAGALAGAVLITGCGASGAGTAYRATSISADNLSPAAAVSAATAATAASGSASVHLTLTTSGKGGDASVDVRGVVDLDGSAADLTATLPGRGPSGSAPTTVSERLVDGVLYLRVEGSDVLPATWLKLDPSALPAGVGDALGGVLGGAGTGTVTAPLDALREVADVEEVGRQQVDGIATTHYRATLDPAKVAASLAPLAGVTAPKLGTAPAPVDVWVDAEGHVVRVTQKLDLGATDGSVSWQLDLREVGAPVAVTAPKGALDIGGILGSLGGLAGGDGAGLGGLSGLLDGLGGTTTS